MLIALAFAAFSNMTSNVRRTEPFDDKIPVVASPGDDTTSPEPELMDLRCTILMQKK